MALPLSGNFSETPFSDIITVLRLQKANGTLACMVSGTEKHVYVKQGQIVFASSRDEKDRLGEVLITMGMIDRGQLNRALEVHRKDRGLKKIGAIFVELGYLAPKDLFNGLKQQVRSILHSLFVIEEGAYDFSEDIPAEVIPLSIDIGELLREVIEQLKAEQ